MINYRKTVEKLVLCGAGACSATAFAGEIDGFWLEFSQWKNAMNAAGAPVTGFNTDQVLAGQSSGTLVASDAFSDWGVTMQSTRPLEVYQSASSSWDVWGGPSGPSMTWDIVLDTPVYSAYVYAGGSCPVDFYLGDTLVSQPLGDNPVFSTTWFGVQLNTPFDRVRIQYEGAPLVTIMSGFYWAMPVPGPGAAMMMAVATPWLLESRRRKAKR